MLVKFNADTYRDFNQRYVGAYGWLITPTNKKLININSVDGHRVYYNIGGATLFWAELNSATTFEFIPVDHGLFNGRDGYTYYMHRKPARQWRRGISENNTVMEKLHTHKHVPINYQTLENIFNDEFSQRNYPQVFETGALSKHFAVLYGKVYFYSIVIGNYANDEIILNNEITAQELKDLIHRNHWNIKVTNANL